MNATPDTESAPNSMLPTLARLRQVVPPLFPLRHFVAVNPFAGRASEPIGKAAVDIARTEGAALFMPRSHYLELWKQGRLSFEDLKTALGRLGMEMPLADLESWVRSSDIAMEASLPTFAAWLDRSRPGAAWDHWVACQVGHFCGAYFDVNQATWSFPWKHLPLLDAWREYASHDASPEVAGIRNFRELAASLPETPEEAIAVLCAELVPAGVSTEDFLLRQIARLPGWAGHVQYRAHEHALRGREDNSLDHLLAVSLAYDVGLLRTFGTQDLRNRWAALKAWTPLLPRDFACAQVWQTACEVAFQRRFSAKLKRSAASAKPSARPRVQMVFCIDVRSERLRRHLEAVTPEISTHGFAGFFGIPVAHTDPATGETTSRLPALLAPKLTTGIEAAESEKRAASREITRAWQGFQHAAASCFAYVEAFGLGGLAKARRSRPRCHAPEPSWASVSLEDRTTIAEGALRGMGLDRDFARVVVLCGHGSENINNPQASALECGACGGHAGDVNARLAVQLFNDERIRSALATRGIAIPEDTQFVAGIHNTTTDEVSLYPCADAAGDLTALRAWLEEAARRSGSERDALLGALGHWGKRAEDPSETRPEFGLAGNAAILFASRSLSRGADLGARVFLHDYDASADPSQDKLTSLLGAPGVVASWINLQYYASRVSPGTHGAGNKVLHNVCGGIGVLEGNAGDLRPGLSWQSLHDGQRFVHEPLRLTVAVAAPRAAVDAALARLPAFSQLVTNQWIHIMAFEGDSWLVRYAEEKWCEV